MSVTELDDRERERLLRSATLACVLWLAVLALLAVIPARVAVDEARDFPSVMIRLSARSPVTAQAPARSDGDARAAPQTPAAEKPAASKQVSAKQVAAKPATPTPAAPRAARSDVPSGGLGIPDFAPADRALAGAKAESATLEFSSEPVSKPQAARTSVGEFEGSVAVASGQRAGERVTSTAPAPAARRAASSDETSRSLSSISGSAGAGTDESSGDRAGAASSSADSARSSMSPSAASRAGGSSGSPSVGAISFTEGAQRRLVHPANPSLALPERLARLIDSNRAVFVTITVRADGSVPRSTVVFSPSALLPPEVRDYIAGEVSSWRFDRGAADGQARFSYSIKVQ